MAMEFDKLLVTGVERGASDLHLKANSPVVLRIHERPAPSFPPVRRDALLLGGTVFDLLQREEGDDACLELARAPDPQKALERAFHGRPFRQTEQAWRSHLNRLARP